MTEKPSNGVLAELRALAREVSENHEWLDADELEDDEAFARLVELLSNTDRVPPKTSRRRHGTARSICARERSPRLRPEEPHLRTGQSAPRSGSSGRTTANASSSSAHSRLGRKGGSSRSSPQRTRAGAAVRWPKQSQSFWTPASHEVSVFSAGDFARLSPGLQPLVSEILETAGEETRASSGPSCGAMAARVDRRRLLQECRKGRRSRSASKRDDSRLARSRHRCNRRGLGRTSAAVAHPRR